MIFFHNYIKQFKGLLFSGLLNLSDVNDFNTNNGKGLGLNTFTNFQNKTKKEIFEILDSTNTYPVEIDTVKHTEEGPKKIKEKISLLDLYELPLKSRKEISTFIQEKSGINIFKDFDEWTRLFSMATDFYEQRYMRKLPNTIKQLNFSKKDDILNFIQNTQNGKNGILYCILLKIMFVTKDVTSVEELDRAGDLDEIFIENYLSKPFQIQDIEKADHINRKKGTYVNAKDEIIKFDMLSRPKEIQSMMGKELADVEYHTKTQFKDRVGATIMVDNHHHMLDLLNRIKSEIFNDKDPTVEITEKNTLSPEILKTSETYLFQNSLEDFKNLLSKHELEGGKNKLSSTSYKDIKIKGTTIIERDGKIMEVGVEIKFVLAGHDNEKGLSFHPVYDYAKRFRELSRMGMYIREHDIINYVNDFFENLEANLSQKYPIKEENAYLEELFNDLQEKGYILKGQRFPKNFKKSHRKSTIKILHLGLYQYYQDGLQKVKIPGGKGYHYLSKDAYNLSGNILDIEMKDLD